jgi:hypothetical protein
VLGRKLKISILILSSTEKPFVTIDEKMRNNCVKIFSVSSVVCQELCCSGDKTTESVLLSDGSMGLFIFKYVMGVTKWLR